MSNSTCLRADLANSNIGPVNKSQAPSKKKPDGGLNEVAYSQPQATQKHHPFRASQNSKHEDTNMKCKPNCAPGGTLSKTRLASCSGGVLARSTGEMLASRSGLILARCSAGLTGKGYSAGCSAGSTGELLWDTQGDTGEPVAPAPVSPRAPCRPVSPPCHPVSPACHPVSPRGLVFHCLGQHETTVDRGSTVVSFIFGTTAKYPVVPKIKFRRYSRRVLAAGYSAGSLAGYSAGSTGEPLWRDTWRDPLASRSGGILGIHWRAALAGHWAGSTQLLWQDTRPDPLASRSAGSTDEPLWRDTWRDPLASRSGGILGRIHWRAALAGYSAGSTALVSGGRDTRRNPLASCSGGILGGIHWRATWILSGILGGIHCHGELLWRDTVVGAWCRSIAHTDSNIKSSKEQYKKALRLVQDAACSFVGTAWKSGAVPCAWSEMWSRVELGLSTHTRTRRGESPTDKKQSNTNQNEARKGTPNWVSAGKTPTKKQEN